MILRMCQNIIEWSRHNIRAAQQDLEKAKIISQMGIDEAFYTFDRDQKILRQEYRESQKKYFGKKRCVSFCWFIRLERRITIRCH